MISLGTCTSSMILLHTVVEFTSLSSSKTPGTHGNRYGRISGTYLDVFRYLEKPDSTYSSGIIIREGPRHFGKIRTLNLPDLGIVQDQPSIGFQGDIRESVLDRVVR